MSAGQGWFGRAVWRWLWGGVLAWGLLLGLAACGGSADDGDRAAADSADEQAVLVAVPQARRSAMSAAATGTSLRIHYHRAAGDYAGWQVHSWGAAQDPGWNQGWNASGSDGFGAVYDIPLAAQSGTVGYLFHVGDSKDHGGADQAYTLVADQANEIWRVEGDPATYLRNPYDTPPPDLTTVRVHYLRYAGDYPAWGLHLWGGSGLDTDRLSGLHLGDWGQPVAFAQLPGYASEGAEVVFDLPVLNPKDDSNRRTLSFILHGMPPNENDKDGRSDNIVVNYGALTVSNQVGHIWLREQDATVYTRRPDTRSASTTDARAVWLNRQLLQWPAEIGRAHV